MIERRNLLFTVTQVTRKCNLEECSMFWIMLTLFPQTCTFRIKKLCCMFLKTMKAVIKIIFNGKKSHNETCFQDPLCCPWLVIRSNHFGPKNQNQVHWHQKPTRRHVNQKIFHTWRMESSFCVCQTLATTVLQFVLKWCQKERKKNQVKKESQQSQDQWWIWLQGLPQLCHLLHQKARGREVIKVKVLWVCKLRNMIERWNRCWPWHKSRARGTTSDLLKARTQKGHTQQATQDGTMTKLGLLKNGKQMNWWNILSDCEH